MKKNAGRLLTKNDETCCVTTDLKKRPLLTLAQADRLAAVFKILSNDTRLRILHAIIRAEQIRVTDLADVLGMKPQAVSNQLQRLSDLGILAARREGNNIHYRLIDRCVSGLVEQAWCLMESSSGQAGIPSRILFSVAENPQS